MQESFCQYVVELGSELVVDDASTHPRLRDNPTVVETGRAWAGFPLLAPDGEVLGSFCVVDVQPRRWTARDREVLRVLSLAASGEIALRAAAEDARELARTLQASLLPVTLPRPRGLDVAAYHRAGGTGTEVVGDFYDLFESTEGTWEAVVGDVCGKGVPAATVTALARYTIRAAAMDSNAPCAILSRLNRAMIAQQPADGRFLTAAMAQLRPTLDGVELRLCSGGHAPTLLRRADGAVETLSTPGTLLGAFEEIRLSEVEAVLRPGDALVMYTDGVTEARRGHELFGEERLRAVLAEPVASAEELAVHIEDAVAAFASGPPADDMAVLVLRAPTA